MRRFRALAIVFVFGALFGPGATTNAWPQTPQSQCSVLSGRPCHPSFCSIFHHGPCQPYYLPPIGEDLQLTIVSTDQNDPTGQTGGAANGGAKDADQHDDADHGDAANHGGDAQAGVQPLDSISAMYAALRTCWVPPPRGEARHGMQYTIRFAFKRDGEVIAPPRVTYSSHDAPAETRDVYRDAVNAALARCTPLHFSPGMAGAVAGRPIAIRFVDNRTIDNTKSLQ